jgi:hypothetical protein
VELQPHTPICLKGKTSVIVACAKKSKNGGKIERKK